MQWTIILHTSLLLASCGQRDSLNIYPAVGRRRNWFSTLQHCLEVVGSGIPCVDDCTAWEPWAVELFLHTTALLGRSEHWDSLITSPQG